MPIAFPRPHLASLQELATTVLDRRAVGCPSELLARDLLSGFYDVCMRCGLDGVLREIEQTFGPLELVDGAALADDQRLRTALAERLDNKAEFDHGGPRNAKPRQLAECLVAALTLGLHDEVDPTITFGDEVRAEVAAAVTSVVEAELAIPQVRATVIANGRERCDARFHDAYDKLSALLDERGVRITRQPKLPLDAVQAVQQALLEARQAVLERTANAAIDRVISVLAKIDPEAAARIDRPITLRLTPRDVTVRRASDPRLAMAPAAVMHAVFEGVTLLCHLAWRALEQPVRTYAASQTFAVGDLLEHPKFGRGSVLTSDLQRIEVEFPDGPHTLVHARTAK